MDRDAVDPSEHPDYLPAAGAAYVASKLDAIASNPDVWYRTVFILTYDENDGLFYHVPPPVPSPGDCRRVCRGQSDRSGGFRVPAIVISPYSQGGWVCSDAFDHTSVIRFLESRFGVNEPNISAFRRATLGDLTSSFLAVQSSGEPVPVAAGCRCWLARRPRPAGQFSAAQRARCNQSPPQQESDRHP